MIDHVKFLYCGKCSMWPLVLGMIVLLEPLGSGTWLTSCATSTDGIPVGIFCKHIVLVREKLLYRHSFV